MYSAASLSNRVNPSRASLTQVSAETTGFRNSLAAEALTRAQWRSRSGETPSKCRAPSNTTEQSHAACVRGPMIGTFPSCQAPSKNVQVFDQPSPDDKRLLLRTSSFEPTCESANSYRTRESRLEWISLRQQPSALRRAREASRRDIPAA